MKKLQSYDRGNRRVTEFVINENASIADGQQFKNDITNIISQWNNGLLTNTARSELVSTDKFRIDMQGMINWNDQRYYNLQIQKNVRRQPGTSTTYSQVLVPENLQGVTDRHVRGAFVRSFLQTVWGHNTCTVSWKPARAKSLIYLLRVKYESKDHYWFFIFCPNKPFSE